jgi:hypothetical protein
MKLLHHLTFLLLHITNDDEMKTIECDFVKMKFHLNKNYVEWICIMQVELNAIQLNLKSIKISKIEFNFFWIELKFLNWIKHNIHFKFKKVMFPLKLNLIEFNHIEYTLVEFIQTSLNSTKL